MSDKIKAVAGLVVLVALVTFPFWYPAVADEAKPQPDLPAAEEGERCIEEARWMTANHMDLLDQWRNDVVRGDGTKQEYESKDFEGVCVEKSLTKTCFQCHTMQAESDTKRSCIQCHNYANVETRCMDCHVEPEGI